MALNNGLVNRDQLGAVWKGGLDLNIGNHVGNAIHHVGAGEKDENLPELYLDYWGTAPSIKNGKLWNPKIYGGKIPLLGHYGIAITEHDSGKIRRRNLSITKILGPEIGIFKIEEVDINASNRIHAFFTTTLDDGDVLGDVFLLVSS